jgi:hypothetical protein
VTRVNWTKDFPGSITICDMEGIIVEMNERATALYRKEGRKNRVGECLFDCHPEPARTKLEQLLRTGETNVYTIEKNGTKKFIYQAPWLQEGKRCGMIELVLEVSSNPPHFVRK